MPTENENNKKEEDNYYIEPKAFYDELVIHLKYRKTIVYPFQLSLEGYYLALEEHFNDIKKNINSLPNILTRSVTYPAFPKSKQEKTVIT